MSHDPKIIPVLIRRDGERPNDLDKLSTSQTSILVHDPRPVRFANEEDAKADMDLYRAKKLPTAPFKDLEGNTFQISYFPHAVPAFIREGESYKVNPAYVDAPIELRVMLWPDPVGG